MVAHPIVYVIVNLPEIAFVQEAKRFRVASGALNERIFIHGCGLLVRQTAPAPHAIKHQKGWIVAL
jgi:hypothetical protein